MIGTARPLYANEPLAVDPDATVYAFDAPTLPISMEDMLGWAPACREKHKNPNRSARRTNDGNCFGTPLLQRESGIGRAVLIIVS